MWRSLYSLTLVIFGLLLACDKTQNSSNLQDHAEAESDSQVVKIRTHDATGNEKVIFGYITGSETNRRVYELSCPSALGGINVGGLNKLTKGLGWDMGTFPPMEMDDNNPEHKAQLDAWKLGQQPLLRCQYKTGEVKLRSVNYPSGETKYFLAFTGKRNEEGAVILYNVGCESFIRAVGFAPDQATSLPYDIMTSDYASGDEYDISCASGQTPTPASSFISSCDQSREDSKNPAQKTYLALFAAAGYAPNTVGVCAATDTWLKSQSELDLSNRNLVDISPLKFFPNIMSINLSGNTYVEWQTLASLPNLAQLTVAKASITDLSSIATGLMNASKLMTLNLQDNAIVDLNPIAAMNRIVSLNLAGNVNLRDLQPLSRFIKLASLSVDGTAVKDMSVLQNLTALNQFSIRGNVGLGFADFEPLKFTQIQAPVVNGTPLAWKAEGETFFTNCLFYEKLPETRKNSFKAKLQALGAEFAGDGKVLTSCQILTKQADSLKVCENGRQNGETWKDLDPDLSHGQREYVCDAGIIKPINFICDSGYLGRNQQCQLSCDGIHAVGDLPWSITGGQASCTLDGKVISSCSSGFMLVGNECKKTCDGSHLIGDSWTIPGFNAVCGSDARAVFTQTDPWARDQTSDSNHNGVCDAGEDCVYRYNADGRLWKTSDGVARTRDEAVFYCEDLVYGGFDDWHLPRQLDLYYAYKNGIQNIKGPGFSAKGSWSLNASEKPDSGIYVQDFFGDPGVYDTALNTKLPIVCIR